MGEHRVRRIGEAQETGRFVQQLLRDVQALERMIAAGLIETGVRRIGAEQELFLIDAAQCPLPIAPEVLARATDPRVTTEIARFNLEVNLEPLHFEGNCLRTLETDLVDLLASVRELVHSLGAEIVLAGVLPTLRPGDLVLDHLTPGERYQALNERLMRLRGGAYELHIRGPDELILRHDTVMPEACNTSFQVHLQVGAEEFARVYNAAQVATGPVLAAAGNAPLLFGKRLWQETRIALFQQAVDMRQGSFHLRERCPRVRFGTEWVRASVLELFQEGIARFRVLMQAEVEEDALGVLEAGGVPTLNALQVHNSTVYHWNRACYGTTNGKPHLRIENRALPSGPTPLDEVANAAFWLGLVQGLLRTYGDVTAHLAFDDAKRNFYSAAQQGLEATFHGFGRAAAPAPELILDTLLPMAREGLQAVDIDEDDIARYLGVVEARVRTRQTGARWQLASWAQMPEDGDPSRRLRALVAGMVRRQQTGQPVHTWDPARLEEAGPCPYASLRVEQFMSTDLFTVGEDEVIDLAAAIMDWRGIRHLLVEDDEQRLVGLVSIRALLHRFVSDPARDPQRPIPVADVATRALITVTPETPLREAVALLQDHRIGALPVVRDDRLIGILTERDLVRLTRRLLEQEGAVHDGRDRAAAPQAHRHDGKLPHRGLRERP